MSLMPTYTLKKENASFLLKTLMGFGLIALSAQVSIPLNPVPITLHTFAVCLIALIYTPKETASSIGFYLTLGFMGAPLFSNFTGGPQILFSPRAGYLIGCLLGGILISWLNQKHFIKNLYSNMCFSILAGQSVLYLCGISGLLFYMDLSAALQVGFVPFIIPGIAKTFLLTGSLGFLKSKKR